MTNLEIRPVDLPIMLMCFFFPVFSVQMKNVMWKFYIRKESKYGYLLLGQGDYVLLPGNVIHFIHFAVHLTEYV